MKKQKTKNESAEQLSHHPVKSVEVKTSMKVPRFIEIAKFIKIKFKYEQDAIKFNELFIDTLYCSSKKVKGITIEQSGCDVTISNMFKRGYIYYSNGNIANIFDWNEVRIHLIYQIEKNVYVPIAVEILFENN